MAETCHSRSLSWLVKSCLPDSRRDLAKSPSAISSSSSPISSLPDDLLLECLSRVPLSSLPSLSLVCRRFSLLLDSPSFLSLRRSLGHLRLTLLALSISDLPVLSSAALDSDTWHLSTSPLPLLPEIFDASFSHPRVAAIGRAIFIIGRGATLRLDTWTAAISPRAPTLFPRKKFAAAAIGGKIYVAGGSARTSAVEEYDPDLDSWRVVAEAPIRRYGCVGAAVGGVFYLIGGLRVGGAAGGGGGGRMEAHVCAGSMDAYHVRVGAWMRARATVPGGGCVVGACGAGPHVYVLASHAVEVSFWRWEEKGRRGGEWTRLEAPPVPGQVRLGGAVRFSCAAVGDSQLVALVHVSGGGHGGPESARRGYGREAYSMEGAVLVYDIGGGEWTRGPDLPAGLRRAALACVEC